MMNKKSMDDGRKILASNRKARHLYHILETAQAGIVLQGTEVKSLRGGHANLKDSYAVIDGGEIFLLECHIDEYTHGNRANHNPTRKRKLLLHKREIQRLFGKIQGKGFTLVPLSLYLVRGKVKVDIALARGKKLYDKRDDIKQRDLDRDMQREQSGKPY